MLPSPRLFLAPPAQEGAGGFCTREETMSVTLLLLRHLFPEWSLTLDPEGTWRATGRILISASSVEGLLDLLLVADPEAVERAARLLEER